jgi:hypothetical protein
MAPTIGQQAIVVVRDAPRAGIDVEALVELAFLRVAAEFGDRVAAAYGPVTAASAAIVFEDLHLVAGLAQFESRQHAGQARAKNQHRGALRIALELDRTLVVGFGRQPQAGHGLVHRGATRGHADQFEKVTPAHAGKRLF